jgi:hypothetical protein
VLLAEAMQNAIHLIQENGIALKDILQFSASSFTLNGTDYAKIYATGSFTSGWYQTQIFQTITF